MHTPIHNEKVPPVTAAQKQTAGLLFGFVFTGLVCNPATGFAGGLARGLTFAAAAVFGAFAQVAGVECFKWRAKNTPLKSSTQFAMDFWAYISLPPINVGKDVLNWRKMFRCGGIGGYGRCAGISRLIWWPHVGEVR